MTDRELLELAAKAVGIPVAGFHADGDIERMDGGWWNPLVDDGDALRLAVKLRIETEFCAGTVYAGPRKTAKYAVDSPVDQDMLAATRRAIVRAAADIGEAMQ